MLQRVIDPLFMIRPDRINYAITEIWEAEGEEHTEEDLEGKITIYMQGNVTPLTVIYKIGQEKGEFKPNCGFPALHVTKTQFLRIQKLLKCYSAEFKPEF